jgi:hypothetical protein
MVLYLVAEPFPEMKHWWLNHSDVLAKGSFEEPRRSFERQPFDKGSCSLLTRANFADANRACGHSLNRCLWQSLQPFRQDLVKPRGHTKQMSLNKHISDYESFRNENTPGESSVEQRRGRPHSTWSAWRHLLLLVHLLWKETLTRLHPEPLLPKSW